MVELVFFINNSFNYKLHEDLCINVPDITESIFIELVTSNEHIFYSPTRQKDRQREYIQQTVTQYTYKNNTLGLSVNIRLKLG